MAKIEQTRSFISNLVASATWDGIKRGLGGSLMTALTTALWEKLKHGSLDWYAIGVMFVVTFIVIISFFRKDRKQIGPQTLVVQGAQTLELGIPTLSALLGQ